MKELLLLLGVAGAGYYFLKPAKPQLCLWTIDKDKPSKRCVHQCLPMGPGAESALKSIQKRDYAHAKSLKFEISPGTSADYCDAQ